MQPEQASKYLLSVLRSHHIPQNDEDIRSAFEATSSREHVTAWVDQYLGKDTLLSFEEAQLYSRLEKHDIPTRITANYDLSAFRPLLDDDFENSLKLLEASTAVIEDQTQTLKFQQEALAKIQKNDGQVQAQLKRTIRVRQQNLLQEKQSTSLAADGLLKNLSNNLFAARRELENIRNISQTSISNSLKYDDEKLSKIVQLASSINTSDEQERLQVSKVDALCARLKAYITRGIRCHLDRVYLETIQSSPIYETSKSSENTNLEKSLKAELGTLYTEIDDVAQMTINHEFSEPLSAMIKKEGISREDRIQAVLDNIDVTMNHLQKKIDHMFLQHQTHAAHYVALGTIIDELNKMELETNTNPSRFPQQRVLSYADDDSSLHERSPRDGFILNEHIGIDEDLTEQSHRELLQILGCPLSEDVNLNSIKDFLEDTAYTRQQQARLGSLKLNRAIELSLDATLDASSITNQIVVDSVFEDTKWNEVQFLDDDLRSRMVELEYEIGRIGSVMGGLDLDQLDLANKASQNFVNTWKV